MATILINEGMSLKESEEQLKQLPPPRQFEPEKHSGFVTNEFGDPVEWQRKERNNRELPVR